MTRNGSRLKPEPVLMGRSESVINATESRRSCHLTTIWRVLQLVAVAGLVSVTLLLIAVERANTQTTNRPTINIAAVITAEAATQVPFLIGVGPAASIPHNSFVRVEGLPPMAALSAGYLIEPGSWAIPLWALPGLKITLPIPTEGSFVVLVTLVAIDGSGVLVEARSTLVVSAAPPASTDAHPDTPPTAASRSFAAGAPSLARPAEREERTDPAPHIATPAMVPEDRERALKLVKKGDEAMADGLVAPARLLYERAADLGLAQAAMALAGTYDAAELTRPNLRGIRPDAKEAKRWYERARQLGAGDANERLRRLGAN